MSYACPSIPIVPKLKHFSDEGKLGLVIPRKWLENDIFPHSRVILGFGWPPNESNDKEWLGWGQSHSGRKSSFLGHFLIPDSFWDEWHENEWNDVDIFMMSLILGMVSYVCFCHKQFRSVLSLLQNTLPSQSKESSKTGPSRPAYSNDHDQTIICKKVTI